MEIRTDEVGKEVQKEIVPMATLPSEVRKSIPKSVKDFLPNHTISQEYVDAKMAKHKIKFA